MKKKKRSKGWIKKLLLFVCTPILIWLAAFILWFNWDRGALLSKGRDGSAKPSARRADRFDHPAPRQSSPADQPPRENIQDEDRRQLEQILRTK